MPPAPIPSDDRRIPAEFLATPADRVIGRGHAAGDLLEAYDWVVVDEAEGRIVVDAHLPDHTKNPMGQLFGGFTPTYVDLISLIATRAGADRHNPDVPRYWMATINMRIDYYEPITGPVFRIEAIVERQRGKTFTVTTRMYQAGELAAYALATIRSHGPD
ncbi:MAG: PaaI family thioesterase [Actinomycetota bacterium]